MNYPQYIISLLQDVLFPIKCLGCKRLSSANKDYICRKCLKNIPLKKNFECIGCKINVSDGKTCLRCRQDNYLDQVFIISSYKNLTIIRAIKCLKYRLIADIAYSLSPLLKKYVFWLSFRKKININKENPILIPVPLHARRLNWRGFNQAELLAKELARILQCNTNGEILKRIKRSKPQADIEVKEERLKNVGKDIFKVNYPEKISGRTIILVDDICTTGATLNACAKILKENNASKVIGFVIARG